MTRIILLSTLFYFLLFQEILPQSRIAFKHLTVKDGLSQSSVTCILQDSKGFMWFGTQDGLNRFDGYNFKIFKNDPSDSTSLSENFIFSMYLDTSESLFIETQSGILHKYLPKLEAFKVVNKDSINIDPSNYNTVGASLYESAGIEWSGGLGKGTGLERYDSNSGSKKIFKHDPQDPTSLSNDKVYSIYRDSRGNLWLGTFNGLDRFDESTGEFHHYQNDPKDPNSLPDNWVWPIFEDKNGSLWVGTVRGGLCKFDYQTEKFTNYKFDANDPTSLNDNFIFSIYEDRSGVIWIGTNLGGINYFHPSILDFEHYSHDPDNNNSLNDNIVYSMLVDSKGKYWIGTRDGGLNIFDYENKKFSSITHNPNRSNSLVSNSIISLLEDQSGRIWVGTINSGLDLYDPKSKSFKHFKNKPSNKNSISDNRIYALAEDSDGYIWIGTYGGGINKLNKITGDVIRYQNVEGDNTSLSSDAAWSLAFDSEGNLWAGTFGGGVNFLKRGSNVFEHFNNDPNDSTSISDDQIIRVFIDNKDNLWFGTTKGLSKYLKESRTFKNYSETDGLSNNFIYGIVQDENGELWLSTNNGLSRFDPVNETFKNYYIEDGLQGNEFNQNSHAKDHSTGRLLFGGANGFNVFHPDSLEENLYKPPIVFTNYMRFNTDDEEGKPIIEKGISDRDSLVLTHKDNIITLDFSALSYLNISENEYKYKLEGFNENWIQLRTDHTVTFTNLSPGEYSLKIIGANNDGVWNEEGASLFLDVKPPWWRTNIAYAFYGFAFLSLLLGIRKIENNIKDQKVQIRESELHLKASEAEKKLLEVENERKSKELEEARALQLSMLPREIPDFEKVEIAAFMRTASEVGGDYYDFVIQRDGVINVAFGDATGHGLQAGTMVTLMKGFFTSDAENLNIKEFMKHCSRLIKEIKLGRILMPFTYMKIYDEKIRVSSGGMPPIYYYNKEAEVIEEIVMKGMPLGAMASFEYNIYEKEIKSGDTILLISDGLPEQMNEDDEMYDYQRTKDKFIELAEEKPQEIIDRMIESFDNWMGDAVQGDDVTVMVIRIK